MAAALPAHAEVSKEYQVKAAFVYNFTKFVEWPREHFGDDHRAIVIAVLGQNPFGDELEKILRDRKVGGRELIIKTLASVDDARTADVLFVCDGEEKHLEAVWPSLHAAGVLTIGESTDFAAQGMITFVLEGDKVRFAVNLASVERAHLKFSAQLLKLATTVRRDR